MLTFTTELYKDVFSFCLFGTSRYKTQVYKYLDNRLTDKLISKKIISILNAINSDPIRYVHPQKFKHLEDDVWEIKIKSLRIACIWDTKPHSLIAIYAFDKKQNRWPKQELINMRKQKSKYYDIKIKKLNGGKIERLS